jgi:hypothetical protein
VVKIQQCIVSDDLEPDVLSQRLFLSKDKVSVVKAGYRVCPFGGGNVRADGNYNFPRGNLVAWNRRQQVRRRIVGRIGFDRANTKDTYAFE